MLRSIVAPVQHLPFLMSCDRHRVEDPLPRASLGSLLGSLLDQVIVDPQLNTKQQLLNRVKDEVGRE